MKRYLYRECLRMERISLAINDTEILRNVHLNIFEGEILGICGLNNSGKSALVECISGMHPDYTGRIWLNEQNYRSESINKARNNGIYFIQERSSLIGEFTMMENIEMTPKKMRRETVDKRYRNRFGELMQRFCPEIPFDSRAQDLKLHERIIVEIVKAVLGKASIIILDSVLSRCPDYVLPDMEKMMRLLAGEGISFVIAESSGRIMCRFADRLFVLRKGSNAALLERNEISDSYVAALMTGNAFDRSVSQMDGEKKHKRGEEILRFEHVSGSGVLTDLNFSLYEKESLGILNYNKNSGAAIENVLLGRQSVDSGSIVYRGRPVQNCGIAQKQRLGLFILPEDDQYFDNMSIEMNLQIAAMQRFNHGGFLIDRNEMKYAISEALSEFSFDLSGDVIANGVLPRGHINAKKLSICRAVVAGARTVVFRNVAQNLDFSSRQQLFSCIERLRARGVSMVFIDSDVELLMQLCSRIVVVSRGRDTGEYEDSELSLLELQKEYNEHIKQI